MAPSSQESPNRWTELTGGAGGRAYADRFAALAAQGKDMHGEARFCASLLDPAARVLDAGCGTGRVAIRLAELGHSCVGADADESMLSVAREAAPALAWIRADLATVVPADLFPADLGDPEPFDLVVLAGNVVPLLVPGTLADAVRALAGLLRAGGLLVAGFGLDPEHLPGGCPVTPLSEYDDACSRSGLALAQRFATWDRDPFAEPGGYAVSVHRRRPS